MFLRQYYGIPKNATWEGFMDRFPILFQRKDESIETSCMHYIECPLGWYHIIEQLCTMLEYLNLVNKKDFGVAVVAAQVKEKMGTLRFYFDVTQVDEDGKAARDREYTREQMIARDYLEMMADCLIAEAENLTENTCAICGVPLDDKNKVKTEGYISYICTECSTKEDAGMPKH